MICHFATPAHSLNQCFTSLMGQTLYQVQTNTSQLQCFTAESSRNSRVTQCLEEAEQPAEPIVDVPPPPLQIVISVPFFLFSLFSLSLSSLSSLSQSFCFSILISPSLSNITYFSSDQFSVLQQDEDFKF